MLFISQFNKKQNVLLNELNQLKYDFKFIIEKYEEMNKFYMKKKVIIFKIQIE